MLFANLSLFVSLFFVRSVLWVGMRCSFMGFSDPPDYSNMRKIVWTSRKLTKNGPDPSAIISTTPSVTIFFFDFLPTSLLLRSVPLSGIAMCKSQDLWSIWFPIESGNLTVFQRNLSIGYAGIVQPRFVSKCDLGRESTQWLSHRGLELHQTHSVAFQRYSLSPGARPVCYVATSTVNTNSTEGIPEHPEWDGFVFTFQRTGFQSAHSF